MAAAKARRRRDDFDDLTPKPKSDAYTGMLLISFLAMLVGCVLLFLMLQQFPDGKPPLPAPPPVAPSGSGGAGAGG